MAGYDGGAPPQAEEIVSRASHLRRGWYWARRPLALRCGSWGRSSSKGIRIWPEPLRSMSWWVNAGTG
ncbi:MAG: hypothetical protein ACK55I_20185, partial [bacterium]